MTMYEQVSREAEVLERWAAIYGDKDLYTDLVRLQAARLRVWAAIIKGYRLEEAATWLDRQLARIGGRR